MAALPVGPPAWPCFAPRTPAPAAACPRAQRRDRAPAPGKSPLSACNALAMRLQGWRTLKPVLSCREKPHFMKGLTMSQPAPLTATQRAELKALLEARRQELNQQMEQNRANLAPADVTAGSVSQDESARLKNITREVDGALTALDVADLARIERALELIETDEYGLCDECGCAIPFERLKVEPMTQHCVQCKSRWEQAQAAH
ncbi:hypothetical protein EII18_08580 [Comamonadaceae bacterium OH3737_COT-264]|nr:hypothetical protein EII18_08580 [Comamonadaceae bacterium OH3737_COT-264]